MKEYKTPNLKVVFLQQDIVTSSCTVTNVSGETIGNDCYGDSWLN